MAFALPRPVTLVAATTLELYHSQWSKKGVLDDKISSESVYMKMSKVVGEIDEYKCTVSPDIAKIASEELREDEDIRSQSLQNFRDWIMKNEDIVKCRLDSAFLLRFLRVKKYSLPMAQEVFMKHLANRELLPQYFHNMDVLEPGLDKIFSQGSLIMLKGRNDAGRRVMLANYDKIRPIKEDITALFKSIAVAYEVMLNNEDDQIAGLAFFVDCKGLGLSHVPLFSPTFLQGISAAILKATPMRLNQLNFISLPSFFVKVVEITKYFVGQKLASRVFVYGEDKPLQEVIPKRMLPVELGGDSCTTEELISLWKEEMLRNRESLLSLDEIAIDEKYKKKRMNEMSSDLGTEGSFRQLQID